MRPQTTIYRKHPLAQKTHTHTHTHSSCLVVLLLINTLQAALLIHKLSPVLISNMGSTHTECRLIHLNEAFIACSLPRGDGEMVAKHLQSYKHSYNHKLKEVKSKIFFVNMHFKPSLIKLCCQFTALQAKVALTVVYRRKNNAFNIPIISTWTFPLRKWLKRKRLRNARWE